MRDGEWAKTERGDISKESRDESLSIKDTCGAHQHEHIECLFRMFSCGILSNFVRRYSFIWSNFSIKISSLAFFPLSSPLACQYACFQVLCVCVCVDSASLIALSRQSNCLWFNEFSVAGFISLVPASYIWSHCTQPRRGATNTHQYQLFLWVYENTSRWTAQVLIKLMGNILFRGTKNSRLHGVGRRPETRAHLIFPRLLIESNTKLQKQSGLHYHEQINLLAFLGPQNLLTHLKC